MNTYFEMFSNENAYHDLDTTAAVEHLRAAVQCRTISRSRLSAAPHQEFEKLHEFLFRTYPHVMADGNVEIIGEHSLLITLRGSDDSLSPCLFMSHQDVVPATGAWTYPPFDATIADGFIWGRGTLDVKNQLIACMEAAEYLLTHGHSFTRTVYLAFGDDEETFREGSLTIARTLQQRGICLDFVMDEGAGKIECADAYGAPESYILPIGVAEKGYADLQLYASGCGGHAARPFHGTAVGKLCEAVTDILANPIPPRLPSVIRTSLEILSPYITEEPLVSLVQDIKANETALAAHFASIPSLFPLVATTMAATVINCPNQAANVMPDHASAIINIRPLPGDSCAGILAHVNDLIDTNSVSASFLKADDPSATARQDGYGFELLSSTLQKFFPGVLIIPQLLSGATDAHNYEIICDTCLRCSPFMASREDTARMHGIDERLSIRSYMQGIRVIIDLMQRAGCNRHIQK